ncbi:MAG: hypothetical protein WBD04_07220 [Candidatus Omnitrophota bacterium]
MSKHLAIIILFFCVFIIAGCADVEIPTTSELIKNPLGPGSVRIGMTQAQVVEIYGDPDIKGTVTSKKWNKPREEWIYRADYSAFPVGAGYLTEDQYLYFDGENLTNISDRSLGKETD